MGQRKEERKEESSEKGRKWGGEERERGEGRAKKWKKILNQM